VQTNVKKSIFISIIVSAVLYLGFMIYADFDKVVNSFAHFNWVWFPFVLFLSFGNYTVRFLKWDYYLNLLKIPVGKKDSFLIFMSGLIMSVTPGKMGELLKSYLVKEAVNEPISKTAPIIFAERITDFISLVFLTLIGAFMFNIGREITLGVGIFFIILCIIIGNKKLSEKIIIFFCRIKFISKYAEKIYSAYESSYAMLSLKPLVMMTLLSAVSWFFECFGYYVILINFGAEVNLFYAAFVYTFSTIAGAITMLPGGLGATEGSLTFLIMRANVPAALAVSSTFLIRIATLWFAIFVGIISASAYQKRLGKETFSNSN